MRASHRRGLSILTKIQVFALSVLIAQTLLVLFLLDKLQSSNIRIQNVLEDHALEKEALSRCRLTSISSRNSLEIDEDDSSTCSYRGTRSKDIHGHNSSAWDLIAGNTTYLGKLDFGCETKQCRPSWQAELNETKELAYRSIKKNLEGKTDWKLESLEFGTAFVRVNQIVGLEYMFHTTLNLHKVGDVGRTDDYQLEGSSVIRKKLSPNKCDVAFHTNDIQQKDPIHIIVPYTGRPGQLRLFLENIIELISEGVSLRLIIAAHGKDRDIEDVKNIMEELNIMDFVDAREPIVSVVEVSGDKEGKFSRSVALLNGLEHAPEDALVFYCDVDMKIRKGLFDNCRHNAWRNEQVYYPTMFSLFPYGSEVKPEHGYWRSSSYGMVCAYKEDLMKNTFWKEYAEFLSGWGGEDTMLMNGFNMFSQISVFRALEPNLLHRWHPKHCEWNYFVESCLSTVFENLGSKRFLGWIVAGSGIDVRALNHDPNGLSFKGFGGYDEYKAMHQHENLTTAESYENFIKSGKGGLLSTFASEAAAAKK